MPKGKVIEMSTYNNLTGSHYSIVKDGKIWETSIYDRAVDAFVFVEEIEFSCLAGECQRLKLSHTMASPIQTDEREFEKEMESYLDRKREAIRYINNLKGEEYDGNYKEGKVSIKVAPGMWDKVEVQKTGGGFGEENGFPRHVVDLKIKIDPSSEASVEITLSPSGAPLIQERNGLPDRRTETITYELDKFVLDKDVFDDE